MSSWALALSIAGSVLEFAGVLLIADRVGDLRKGASKARAELRQRARENGDRLRPLLGPRQYAVPGLGRTFEVRGAATMTLSMSANVAGTVSSAGSVDERLARHERMIGDLLDDVSDLKASLPGRIRQGAKDSPWGLTLVLLGILVLLLANVLSIAAA